jgi:ribose transport system permease protein
VAAPDTLIPTPSTRLMVPGFILFALISVGTIRGPSLISSDGIGSAIIVVAPLILATYALTIIVMAGRAGVDLSIGPLIGFINVGLIRLVEAGVISSPIAVFLYAMAVGVAYQLLFGLIVVYVRVQPIIVSLSGYLALVGLNLLILPRPGGVAPDWMMSWGSGTTIFSPVLAIIVIATIGWYILARTAFFGHLRLMGSDERAAYTSGVKINIVRLGAHCIAGVFAGLASICVTALISSGDPTQGTTYTLMAVTALVLGGASLSGGRGGATGSLLGALNIYLITYLLATFNFGTIQSYVTDLCYGTMLVGSLLINSALPQIQRGARYLSPAIVFAILASVGAGVIMHATLDAGPRIRGAASSAASAAAPVTDAAGHPGSAILLVVVGLVAIAYLISLLVRFPRLPTVALILVVVIVGLGMIFHPNGAADHVAAHSQTADHLDRYALDMFALEGDGAQPGVAPAATPLTGLVYAVVGILGVVTLGSVIIALNLFDAQAMAPATVRVLILATIGLVAFVLVVLAWTGGTGAGGWFGRQGLTLAVAAALLFVLMWSPLQGKLQNIAQVYIIVFGVVALGSLYFSAAGEQAAQVGAALRAVMAVHPAIMPPPGTWQPAATVAEAAADAGPVARLAYSLFVMFALQFSLWLAMRGKASLRGAVRFGHTIIGAALAWGGLFYLRSVSLAVILVTMTACVVTAPLVWRAFASYARNLANGDAIIETAGKRGARP